MLEKKMRQHEKHVSARNSDKSLPLLVRPGDELALALLQPPPLLFLFLGPDRELVLLMDPFQAVHNKINLQKKEIFVNSIRRENVNTPNQASTAKNRVEGRSWIGAIWSSSQRHSYGQKSDYVTAAGVDHGRIEN